ncbi:hypothetical protein DOTSEDRAFT_69533 [Dothistroma septosporum NZE10]|uniref:Uncharacterized protein n=1 Tax=Dothistroma septosporum (strain NZE10 / CBS 128990) TaxID=675120 RepID=N1PXC3_DOTSN|nr:hypothetical protein DOTSEDRAFT_69533 [Dothistroma septosporum NZE10]
MLVPRSYKYTSSPPTTTNCLNDKTLRRSGMRKEPASQRQSSPKPLSPNRASTEPVTIPNAAAPERKPCDAVTTMPTNQRRSHTLNIGRRKHSAHDPNALRPAVAALLAVTSIPPRRPNRHRKRVCDDRRISIEELVQGWKSDPSLNASYGSPVLNILLEDTDCEQDEAARKDSHPEPNYLTSRSASSESMPSLDSDDRSILSLGSPSTPGSLRSRRSYSCLKKEKSRSLPASEKCVLDHPLAQLVDTDEDDLLFPLHKHDLPRNKPRSSFKSNLTLSLQSFKKAAVESLSSFSRASAVHSHSRIAAPPIDNMLWSHPFLFPRFSSEVRPATDCSVTEAERRYLNPTPLTFEEQEAPFQQALHAPFLAEVVEDAPTIQLQTYISRGRRRGGPKRGNPNPSSEAGRALLGASCIRQREVRENPDFLRVVVLEMNMRREGKLEQGRAKIWLPPRQCSPVPGVVPKVPSRWQGISAY